MATSPFLFLPNQQDPAVVKTDFPPLQRRSLCWHKEMLHVRLFQGQQLYFLADAARVPGQAAAGANHTVARDNDGNFIVPDRTAYGLCRHPGKAVPRRQMFCQFTVGRGLTVWNLKQQLPYLLPEG